MLVLVYKIKISSAILGFPWSLTETSGIYTLLPYESAFLTLCFYTYIDSNSAVSVSLYILSGVKPVCQEERDWISFIV